jgi:hypothetical protein
VSRWTVWSGAWFLLLGASFTYRAVREAMLDIKSLSWPFTIGVVMHSSYSTDGEGGFSPDIGFQYSVGDSIYTGSSYTLTHDIHSYREKVNDVLDEHPVGARVRVYYQHDLPERSVLHPRIKTLNYVVIIIGLLILLFGAILLVRRLNTR